VEVSVKAKQSLEFGEGCDVCPNDEPQLAISVTINKIRLLGATIRKAEGFTSEQAKAFITLYGSELNDRLEKSVREFLAEKIKA
jgi:hypothetical protein